MNSGTERPSSLAVAAVFSAGLLVLFGCASQDRSSEPKVTDAVRKEIYRRAGEQFHEVALLKPQVTDNKAVGVEFAPLILIQTVVRSELAAAETPTVWFFPSGVSIEGREHRQWTYYWQRSQTKRRSVPSFQGIRITLNLSGEPVIWEVLSDGSGAELIWISQSLEIAAGKEFSKALPGRTCSVERSIAEASRVVVPDVVDDGPMPMGPILYAAANGDIHSVACRCSATQAESLGEQGFYRLQETTSAGAKAQIGRVQRPVDFVERWFDATRLTKCLRLPKTF